MPFKVNGKALFTYDGIPYVWESGDTTTAPYNQVKIVGNGLANQDQYGFRVGVGSGRIVVGAAGDDSAGSGAGAAYIHDLNGTQLAKITASDGGAYQGFGGSVAAGCGKIVVGTPADNDNGGASGSAYIFDLDGTQLAKIKPSDGAAGDRFAQAIAIGSGRIVVGSKLDDDNGLDSGSAYIFDLDGTQLAKIKASDGAASDNFGVSVAVGSGRICVGAYNDGGNLTGAAYIYDLNGTQLAKIVPSDVAAGDQFGLSVAVGCGRIVVGAYGDDDTPFTGLSFSGSAYIFDLDGNELKKITYSDSPKANEYFGFTVAIGSGRIVVSRYGDSVNGTNSGSVYVFDLDGNEISKITASDGAQSDQFGLWVAAGSGRIVAGAYGDDNVGANSGSAYIFKTPNVYTAYEAESLEKYGGER